MPALRAFIMTRRHLAMALIGLALLLKAMIPAGFMLASDGGRTLTITICSDATNGLKQMQLAIPGKQPEGSPSNTAQKDGHCAFAGLAKVAIGGADPFLLALAFAFILLLGLAPAGPGLRELPDHLRPPLRGPPALA